VEQAAGKPEVEMTLKERWTWVGLAVLAAIALLLIAKAVGA